MAGSVSPVLEEGTVVGAEAVFRDLSEVREARTDGGCFGTALSGPLRAERGRPEELRRWEEVGTKVILKGVENAEHFARARGRGIALAQGYYSGPPSPPEVLS